MLESFFRLEAILIYAPQPTRILVSSLMLLASHGMLKLMEHNECPLLIGLLLLKDVVLLGAAFFTRGDSLANEMQARE